MENWNQKFGNAFIGILMMFFVMAFFMLFFGCEITLKTEEVEKPKEAKEDSTSTPSDTVAKSDYFDPNEWILFSPY